MLFMKEGGLCVGEWLDDVYGRGLVVCREEGG